MITVKKKTGPVGDLIGGFIFLAAGLAVVYFMGTDFTLICDRAQNKCVIEEDNFLKAKEINTTLNLSDIQKAEVVESRDSKGKSSYQVMLATHATRVPIADFSTGSYGTCSKNANKINQYINSKEAHLSVTTSGKLPMALGFLFAAVGAWLLVMSLWRLLKVVLGLVLVVAGVRPR